jgi:1-acyl-sn-glycerol-3-phosphate acyltransferase
MIAARSFLFNVLFYANLICLMIFGIPTILAGHRGVIWLAKVWGRNSLWLLKKVCNLDVEFRGIENIPSGGFIIAPKHQSIWDTFALLNLFGDFTFVLKRELTWIPVFGWYLKAARQIAINRSSGSSALAEAMASSKKAMEEGRQVFIFPEGTRRPAGAAPLYKHGVASIYYNSGAKCLPIALNAGLFWPRRSFLRLPGKVLVQILSPIEPGLEKAEFLRLLIERMETATDALLRESLDENPMLRNNLSSDSTL